MPTLDQYQSRVGLPRAVPATPASPGIVSQQAAIAGLEGANNAFASASSIFARQSAQEQLMTQAEQAARDLSRAEEAFVAARDARRQQLGTTDQFGNPVSPRTISQGFQADARTIYDEFTTASATHGPAYQKYLSTQLTQLHKLHLNAFSGQMESAQKDYTRMEFDLNQDELARNAIQAESPGVRNYFMQQMLFQSRLHAAEVGGEHAAKAFITGQHHVAMSVAQNWIRANAAAYITASHNNTIPKDFPVDLGFFNAAGDKDTLYNTAREALSTQHAIDTATRENIERQSADVQQRTANTMMGDLTNPDPQKRMSPAVALSALSSPQTQARMGSHFHTVQSLALALQDKGVKIVTDQKVYTDVLSKIYTHEIVDPLDIITRRPSLDDGDFRHALTTLSEVKAKDDAVSADEFRQGTAYINGRLKAISIFGGPQNQEIVTLVQGQFNRWYDEQRRRGAFSQAGRPVDIEGVARKFADDAWIAAGPPLLSDLAKQRQVLESGWTARQKSGVPVTSREVDDYVNTKFMLDSAEEQLQLQGIKRGAESSSSKPTKPPSYRATE